MVIGSSKVSPEPLSIPVSGGVSLGTRGAASLSPPSPQGLGKTLSAFSKTTPEIGGSKENDREDKVEKNLDNNIPFRLTFLRDSLISDFPEIFQQSETKSKFFRLCKWLPLRNAMKFAIMFEDIDDIYSYIDPDSFLDTASLKWDEKEGYFTHFIRLFSKVMEIGDFDLVSQAFMDASFKEQSESTGGFMGTGLSVKPVDTNVIDFQLWYRGKITYTKSYRTWRTLFLLKTQKFHLFDRLVVMYRRRPEAVIKELEARDERSLLNHVIESCYDFILRQGKKTMSMSSDLMPGVLYLKVFKNVNHTDIDMLLPGAEAKFTWLDYIVIWGSVLFAIGYASYKAATGTLKFDTYLNIALAVGLIVMPLYGAFNGYLSLKQKIQDLQSHLNGLYIMHNISSNNGTVSQVLDEALEQEDKETILAYFFLWCGLKTPKPLTKKELDLSIEQYLKQLMTREAIDTAIDFEVSDGLEKLRRIGILSEECDTEPECKLFKALPLDQALEAANINKFNELREVLGTRRMKAGAPVWQECVEQYPSTGQKFRFFWNAETGESTYTVPSRYLLLQDPSLGLIFPSEPSAVPSDPLKGKGA